MADRKTDALIIGAGPAGLTIALTLARQQQSSIVFDAGTYRNDPADYMHLIPGFDHVSPADYRDTARNNLLTNYSHISFQSVTVSAVEKDITRNGFILTDETGKTWEGKKVVLANGVEDVYPDIAGYAECWGKKIFHCLFCKGYEERGCESAGVLAIGGVAKVPVALHVARQVLTLSDSVTIYTNGSEELAQGIRAGLGTTTAMRIESSRIKAISLQPGNAGVSVEFEDGNTLLEGFLAHTPDTKPWGPFAAQLDVAVSPSGDIKAGPPFYETSVKGVFAAGDNCSMMKNVPNAIFSGSLAGMGVSSQIMAEALGQKPLF